MNKYLMLLALAAFLFSCKGRKTSLAANDEGVDAHDFVGVFQPLKLPYEVTDTILRRREDPNALINNSIFSRIVPDSVLGKYFNKESRPKLYAIGKILNPGHETYLLVKATAASRKALFILAFTKKDEYSAARPILYSDNEPGYSGQATLDNRFTLTVSHQRKGQGGQPVYHHDAYIYNDAGAFTLIMTESNEGASRPAPIYNPIDTLPHKHKYTGDYALDKRNLVSIRDGREPSRILFFVHFEQDEGNCKGELKGTARFISPSVARYTSYGDPCMIEFSFGPSSVTMREIQGCGNHRDIKCFFDGEYPRRKEPVHAHPSKHAHT